MKLNDLHVMKACDKTNKDNNIIPKAFETLDYFFKNLQKKFLGGAPNSTIAALTDVRNGFGEKSVIAGQGANGGKIGIWY